MLAPETQQKIINNLLKRPQNHYCSDCNGKSPCWASLDFGVFVCMNCSGAHRALGPSITRVKSNKLDTWNKDWVQNMTIGNSILNKYWEHQLSSMPMNTKPNVNSSLSEIKKFVYDKYLKKKYVDPSYQLDPLSRMKKGQFIPQVHQQKLQKDTDTSAVVNKVTKTNIVIVQQHTKIPVKKQSTIQQHLPVIKQPLVKKPQQQINLLNLHQEPTTTHKKEQQPIISHATNIHQHKPKQITFDNFLQNISNISVDSKKVHHHNHTNHHPAPVHGNYFMSPHGFVNTTTGGYQNQHHGFSVPSHNQLVNVSQQSQLLYNPNLISNQLIHPHNQQQGTHQVTMNINMNMYPNVMNINMGNCATTTTTPGVINPHQRQQYNTINSNQQQQHQQQNNKQFQYNDFFTNGIVPPPVSSISSNNNNNNNTNNNNGFTLDVDHASNTNIGKPLLGNKKQDNKSSWLDQWM